MCSNIPWYLPFTVMHATKYSKTWQYVGCGVVCTLNVVSWAPNTPSMVAGGMYSPKENIPILTRRRYICLYSPAVHHERVDSSWTARGRGLALMVLESSHHIRIVEILEWFHPNRPDLIEDHGIALHVAGCGVLLVAQSLRSCALDRDPFSELQFTS